MIRSYMVPILLAGMIATIALGGAALPAPLAELTPRFQPLGEATLHWFRLHIYDIALYAQGKPYSTNGTAVLSIHYNISIKHTRLQATTLKEWKRMKKGDEEQHARWIKRLDSLWPDVKKGDTLTAYRQRGGPTQFYLGDRLLGQVSDPAFGPAFFAIWLDADCRYPDVRKGLLGLRDDSKKER